MNSQTATPKTAAKRSTQPTTAVQKNQNQNQNDRTPAPAANASSQRNEGATSEKQNQTPEKQNQNHVSHDDTSKETTFHFDSARAKSVSVAGDFSEWEKSPVKMIKGGGNIWHAKVALPPGRHLYRFLVDGEWQDDPNRERVPNCYGTFNNVLDV
jgi:1,4-alpha-glucan branching enzyme